MPIFPATGKDWWCGKHPDRDPGMAIVDAAEKLLEVMHAKGGILSRFL